MKIDRKTANILLLLGILCALVVVHFKYMIRRSVEEVYLNGSKKLENYVNMYSGNVCQLTWDSTGWLRKEKCKNIYSENSIIRITEYYSSGDIMRRAFEGEMPHGKFVELYQNGHVKATGQYFNGKLFGQVTVFDSLGQPKEYQVWDEAGNSILYLDRSDSTVLGWTADAIAYFDFISDTIVSDRPFEVRIYLDRGAVSDLVPLDSIYIAYTIENTQRTEGENIKRFSQQLTSDTIYVRHVLVEPGVYTFSSHVGVRGMGSLSRRELNADFRVWPP